MFNLDIIKFQHEAEKLGEMSSDDYYEQFKKVQELRNDFHFIITALRRTSAGKQILYWYNEWNRLGRENPLVFLNNNGIH